MVGYISEAEMYQCEVKCGARGRLLMFTLKSVGLVIIMMEIVFFLYLVFFLWLILLSAESVSSLTSSPVLKTGISSDDSQSGKCLDY